MESMLGSTIQHIGGVRRPLCLAQVTRFPLIKIAAEVASEIRTAARRPQKLPGARSIKPGTMTDQLVWQDWIFVPQSDHEILEGAGNVTARKARARGPCRRQSRKPGHETLQRVLGQFPIGRDLAAEIESTGAISGPLSISST